MLSKLRKMRGLTQKQLSEKSGISQSRISELEKLDNLFFIQVQTAILLACAFDMTLNDFYCFDNTFKNKSLSEIQAILR